jgi:DNA-binding SARP family transcriptional activator
VRALKERYEEEHRRLADTLEFLSVQSRDLERQVAAFSRLADRLEIGFLPDAPSTAATSLAVRCLGGFDIRLDGAPVDLGTSRNGRAIFKYLVACAVGRGASKELLAELFWPDTPLEQALPSLQSAVYQLRRASAGSVPALAATPLVVFADNRYSVNPAFAVDSDADVFRERLLEGRAREARADRDGACAAYEAALAAYGGELLPEERYAEWATAPRGALAADHLDLLARLARLHLERGDNPAGGHYARLLLQIDPTREDAYRDLMRCTSRLGQRGAALRTYQRCAAALARELELEPDPETAALYHRLMRGEAI